MMQALLSAEVRRCRICDQIGPSSDTGLSSNGYVLMKCGCCKSVLVEQKPDPDDVKRLHEELISQVPGYDHLRTEHARVKSGKRPVRHYQEFLLKRAERKLKGRSLIEIGGGTGVFGVLAARRGWHYIDYDISEDAIKYTQELGLNAILIPPDVPPPLPPSSADLIVMWSVIHLVWDVAGLLKKCLDALTPGGILMINSPNFERETYQQSFVDGKAGLPAPITLNFFTSESLRLTMKSLGFRHIEITSQRFARPQLSLTGLWFALQRALALDPPEFYYALASSLAITAHNLVPNPAIAEEFAK